MQALMWIRYLPGSVEFYENCGKEDWTLKSVFQAHERGQTTRAYPKKGYRVDLISVTSTGVINKNKEKVLGMRKSDSWIFYAIYSDGTKVRDPVQHPDLGQAWSMGYTL